jgi:hypothetical protein
MRATDTRASPNETALATALFSRTWVAGKLSRQHAEATKHCWVAAGSGTTCD